jgi:hypothetical protein
MHISDIFRSALLPAHRLLAEMNHLTTGCFLRLCPILRDADILRNLSLRAVRSTVNCTNVLAYSDHHFATTSFVYILQRTTTRRARPVASHTWPSTTRAARPRRLHSAAPSLAAARCTSTLHASGGKAAAPAVALAAHLAQVDTRPCSSTPVVVVHVRPCIGAGRNCICAGRMATGFSQPCTCQHASRGPTTLVHLRLLCCVQPAGRATAPPSS